MKPTCALAAVALAAGVVLSAGVVCAGDAAGEFEAAYGAEYRRVVGTGIKDDDIDLAGRLLMVAKGIKGDAAGVKLLAGKICDLAVGVGMGAPAGVRDKGYELAVEAIELAMGGEGGRHDDAATRGRGAAATGGNAGGQSTIAAGEGGGGVGEWADKLIDIRLRQWREASGEKRAGAGEALAKLLVSRGDEQVGAGNLKSAGESYEKARNVVPAGRAELAAEIERKQKDLAARRLLVQRREALEAQLKASPDDKAVRENLVLFCLVEQDSPAEAAKFLADDDAGEQANNIRAAAKGASSLPPGTALEMGRWYRQLGSKAASEGGKLAMLERAKECYERFLQLHPARDLARAAAQSELDQIAAAAARASGGKAVGESATDVLKLVQLRPEFTRGSAVMSNGKLHVRGTVNAGAAVVVPVSPQGDYELTVEVSREQRPGSCAINLPVGGQCVTLDVDGWGGSTTRLIAVAGAKDEDVTMRKRLVHEGRPTVLRICVTGRNGQAEIAVEANGTPVLKWRGAARSLSVDGNFRTAYPSALAVGALNGTFAYERIELKMLTGQCEQVSPTAPPRTKNTPPGRPTGR